MKTLYIKFLSFSLCTTLLLSSCGKDFLEVEPKGYIIAKTTNDYELILNAITINSNELPVYLGDEVAMLSRFASAASVTHQRGFKYTADILNSDQLPSMPYLNSVYLYNKVVDEVMSSTGGTEALKQQLLAEARVGRAFCHLLFVNDYALPYQAASSTTDLGVPIITTADVTRKEFKRATMQETYDFILKEITESIPYLKNMSHPSKISVPAAEAMLARTYLYMGDYANSLIHADKAIKASANGTFGLKLYDYNIEMGDNGSFQPIDPDFGPSTPLDAQNKEYVFLSKPSMFTWFYANTFVMTPETSVLYTDSDLRLNFYSNYELFGAIEFPLSMRRNLNLAVFNGLSLPELYLIRAEALARTNNLSAAVDDVEYLRKRRMPENEATVPTAIANEQHALVEFILEERIREFALNGMRWYDMRRLSVDPQYKSTIGNTHRIYSLDGNITESFSLDPKRYALKFGTRLSNEQPELIDNP